MQIKSKSLFIVL